MLPCPLAGPFLPFTVVGFGVGFSLLGSGSSSENDSHTASSFVTVEGQMSYNI